MRSWLQQQPPWVEGLGSVAAFAALFAIFNALFAPHAAILVPTLIATTVWGLLYTGYVSWRDRQDVDE